MKQISISRIKLLAIVFASVGLASENLAFAQTALMSLQEQPETEIVELDGKKVELRRDQIVELELSGAKAPLPALKHELFPNNYSLKRGDAATFYHRAINRLHQLRRSKNPRQNQEKRDRGEIVPIADQNYGELTEYLNKKWSPEELRELKKVIELEGSGIFEELRTATQLRDCDWGFDVVIGKPLAEYVGFLLPEMQELRGITRYLALKAQLEIVEGNFDSAIETMRTGFKLAKTTEETRFLVCSLIGIACSSIMYDQVQNLVGAEGSPNLYWALETLPSPLISVKPAFVAELEFIRNGAGLWFLNEPEKKNLSAEQWSEKFDEDIQNLIVTLGIINDQNQIQGQLGFWALRAYPIAKRELVEWGYDKERVEKMPVAQVIAIHQSRILKIIADELLKYQNMEYPIIEDKLADIDNSILRPIGVGEKYPPTKYRELLPIASMLTPAITAVLKAELRLKRKRRFYQTVEAIRLHIDETGEMPSKLEEITIVPVPKSPETGKPFRYRKIEGAFELWEMHPDGSGIFAASRVLRLKKRK